ESGGFDIKATEEWAFELKKLPANQKANENNAASLLTDLKFPDVSDYLVARKRMKYMDTKQQVGIFPQKPGIFLKGDVTVKQGKLYPLS
ncbi:unnamed protein product, partial [Symbiodinium necroappetens]